MLSSYWKCARDGALPLYAAGSRIYLLVMLKKMQSILVSLIRSLLTFVGHPKLKGFIDRWKEYQKSRMLIDLIYIFLYRKRLWRWSLL